MVRSEKENSQSGIEIVDYDEEWEKAFRLLEEVLQNTLEDLIICIEHVGSTSVKGLGAKPILDIDIVIEDYSVLPAVTSNLEKIGYDHQQNWSFKGREAFGRRDPLVPWDGRKTNWIEHHLYVCHKNSEELARHIAFRNYLRNNPDAVKEYVQLKRNLVKTAKDRTA
ncbi:GrpB family protein [Virgibacillus sp. 6R]|uniref:GrpB family protein n=1 Tax=Metabacillus sp. 22489 TaxID=3453928 RepID=UPI0011A59D06